MKRTDHCAQCQFFWGTVYEPGQDARPNSELELRYGECRRFPAWVQRRPKDCCGEFTIRE